MRFDLLRKLHDALMAQSTVKGKQKGMVSDLPQIELWSGLCVKNGSIDPTLYAKYQVNRGLRDIHGNGVLTGLTEISEIQSFKEIDGEKQPCEGKLYYRGIDIEDIVDGFISEKRFGFEETTYLLLFGELPSENELSEFANQLSEYRALPTNFATDIIMKSPAVDMMINLSRSVLTLHSFDAQANDTSLPNVLRQSLQLIALFPLLSVYGYQTYIHYFQDKSLVIHNPKPELSTAENILHMLRSDSRYSELEATILDLALVLHAEHGGGNNSTFTTRVVSSSGTDTYSTIAAALGSLKGPKHGGANIKVVEMFEDLKANVDDWRDRQKVRAYLNAVLDNEGFDKSGLIYGMGHAIYSLSDPRANIFKRFVRSLAEEKNRLDEYDLYALVEEVAAEAIREKRKIYKGVSANIDFYSGFVYSMLNLPTELFTPIFAIARISGWSAHRMEELINASKIIRPAYKNVGDRAAYIKMSDRHPSGE
jgi:citrate synthase